MTMTKQKKDLASETCGDRTPEPRCEQRTRRKHRDVCGQPASHMATAPVEHRPCRLVCDEHAALLRGLEWRLVPLPSH